MNISRVTFCLFFGFMSFNSQAQQAASIDLGGFELIPTLDVAMHQDDNITRSDSMTSSSWVNVLTPQLLLRNEFGLNQLEFGYRLQRGHYFSSQNDNFTDHTLFSSINYEFNSRHRVESVLKLESGHDDRGTRFSIGEGNTLQRPDEFEQGQVNLSYAYGALSAKARVEANFGFRTLNYQINTDEYLIRDRNTSDLGTTLYYSIVTAADLSIDLKYRAVDYRFTAPGEAPLDSDEISLLIGAKWDVTASTNGFAKIGAQKKGFDDDSREDFSGATWSVGVSWTPNSLNQIDLTSNGETRETNGEGNFIKSKDVSVKWRYEWLERLSTNVSLGLAKDDYQGTTTLRTDDIIKAKLGVNYQFRRWLRFDVSYLYDNRDSNRQTINYDRNLFSFNTHLTL